MSNTYAKSCVIPMCEGEKFSLVHKFPSDSTKFAEWMEIIQKNCGEIEKIKNLNHEQIKKRCFVCCRHFPIKAYKNEVSRSLNLTSVPSLNFTGLENLHLSKASQPDQYSPIKEAPSTSVATKVEVQPKAQVKILNTNAHAVSRPINTDSNKSLHNISPSKSIKRTIITNSKPEVITLKRKISSPEKVTIVKKAKENSQLNSPIEIKWEGNIEDLDVLYKDASIEEIPVESEKMEVVDPPQNKLLALIEVTPEQYKNLSERLASSERSAKVESIISSFLDKDDESKLEAEQKNGMEVNFGAYQLELDLFWLRDHCRCDLCYDHSTFQRKISILDIPDDIGVKSYELKDAQLYVIWNDDHKSSYDQNFLMQNQFNTAMDNTSHILWTKETMADPLKSECRCEMRDYMSDPNVSKSVLSSLHRYGVAFIDGVQATQQNTEFVIRQLFPIHRTLFGEMWTFSHEKQDHSDTAYTNNYLGAHVDNTYFNDASGLQILHCIQQNCIGGENFLIDGFQVAEKLKETKPEIFKRLTTTLVPAEYIEDGHHHKHLAPIIKLNAFTGAIEQIRFNLYDRAPMNTLPKEKIREFYMDLKALAAEIENPENRITFKLEPGTVMIFDNWRVLHGRNAYSGKRTMTGCYVQRTEYQSALRKNNFIQ